MTSICKVDRCNDFQSKAGREETQKVTRQAIPITTIYSQILFAAMKSCTYGSYGQFSFILIQLRIENIAAKDTLFPYTTLFRDRKSVV